MIGLLPLGAGVFLELDRVQRWAATETARVLKEQLGLEASFDVRVHLIPLRLRVENLVVPASDGGAPALRVERVSVSPRIFSLLAGRLDVGDVEIEAPRARLVIENGELKNVSYRLPKTDAKKTKSTSSPFGSLSVNDGRFSVDVDGTHIDTGSLDVDVFAEKGPAFELMASGSGATIARSRKLLGSGVPADAAPVHDADSLCRLELRARIEGSEVLVRRLSLLGVADLDPAQGAAPSCGNRQQRRRARRLAAVAAARVVHRRQKTVRRRAHRRARAARLAQPLRQDAAARRLGRLQR
ncbi:MAG: hypothetical protein QM756_22260 [Polyangiaceae bacterium]